MRTAASGGCSFLDPGFSRADVLSPLFQNNGMTAFSKSQEQAHRHAVIHIADHCDERTGVGTPPWSPSVGAGRDESR